MYFNTFLQRWSYCNKKRRYSSLEIAVCSRSNNWRSIHVFAIHIFLLHLWKFLDAIVNGIVASNFFSSSPSFSQFFLLVFPCWVFLLTARGWFNVHGCEKQEELISIRRERAIRQARGGLMRYSWIDRRGIIFVSKHVSSVICVLWLWNDFNVI